MKKLLSIGLILFCLHSYAEEVEITGICEGEVFIADRGFKVGDTCQGLTIIEINEDAVTFRDNQGQVFTQSLTRSSWEVFMAKVREVFAGLKEKLRQLSQGASKSLSDKVKSVNPSKLPIEEKMRLADKYLEEFRQESNAFFRETEGAALSEQQAVRKNGQFNKISLKFHDRFSALKMPCPYACGNRNNPYLSGYIRWSEDFQRRMDMSFDRAQERLDRILSKAGLRVF